MTLVAVAVTRDHVEALSDTLSYSAVDLGRASKVTVLHHLTALSAVQGPGELGNRWNYLTACHGEVQDLDELGALAQQLLPAIWQDMEKDDPDRPSFAQDGFVALAGWSPRRKRMVSTVYRSTNGFEPQDVTGEMLCWPPAEGPAPQSEKGWASLGQHLHKVHAMPPWPRGHIVVGGDLWLTSLTRDSLRQRRLHTFSPDTQLHRLGQMGSLRPLGQLGPCICGQGQPYAVCHLRWREPGSPCPCRSGQLWGGCCRVDPDSSQAREHWSRYAGDFRVGQDELRARWRQERPDEDGPPPPQVIPPA